MIMIPGFEVTERLASFSASQAPGFELGNVRHYSLTGDGQLRYFLGPDLMVERSLAGGTWGETSVSIISILTCS